MSSDRSGQYVSQLPVKLGGVGGEMLREVVPLLVLRVYTTGMRSLIAGAIFSILGARLVIADGSNGREVRIVMKDLGGLLRLGSPHALVELGNFRASAHQVLKAVKVEHTEALLPRTRLLHSISCTLIVKYAACFGCPLSKQVVLPKLEKVLRT